jgi:hypothetical protein
MVLKHTFQWNTDNSRECTYRCGNLTFFSDILVVCNQNNPFSNQIGSTPWSTYYHAPSIVTTMHRREQTIYLQLINNKKKEKKVTYEGCPYLHIYKIENFRSFKVSEMCWRHDSNLISCTCFYVSEFFKFSDDHIHRTDVDTNKCLCCQWLRCYNLKIM